MNDLVKITNKYKEICTTGNLDEFDELVHPEFERYADGKTQKGVQELKEIIVLARELNSNLTVTGVEDIVAGDRVITRIEVSGVFNLTNKPWKVNGVAIYQIKENKLYRQWVEVDALSGSSQAGMALVPTAKVALPFLKNFRKYGALLKEI
ncbi:ester cyclase [Marinobacter sp. AL4B]|uniref:ester cyclase n=1 Tax=Marinobacter sp. AL4B TaxID=2871173 RepID=UPI001CAA4C67|nr:nuclear transport factor 2 family protein [Marinobacter sp. AL4B]MBZ0333504.1 nuclear transport factor 2 family protein [Marinobacter sp. AL4B]